MASRASPASRANCSCDWASSRSTVKGLLRPDAYVAADQIDRVEGNTVHLTVTDEDLLSNER